MLRCHECGDPIDEGEQQKRTVLVGRSYWSGSGWGGGWYHEGGTVNEYGEVWLCPTCTKDHDWWGRVGCACVCSFVALCLGMVGLAIVAFAK